MEANCTIQTMGDGVDAKEGPSWLQKFIFADFFVLCHKHSVAANGVVTKREKKYFCVDCREGPICKIEAEQSHKEHVCLQVRKASHEYSIKVDDIKLFVNLSRIQFFYINHSHIVFLKERIKQPNPVVAPSHCKICNRSLMDEHARFCSIQCKLVAIKDPRGVDDTELTLSNRQFKFTFENGQEGIEGVVVKQHFHYVSHQQQRHFKGRKNKCKSKLPPPSSNGGAFPSVVVDNLVFKGAIPSDKLVFKGGICDVQTVESNNNNSYNEVIVFDSSRPASVVQKPLEGPCRSEVLKERYGILSQSLPWEIVHTRNARSTGDELDGNLTHKNQRKNPNPLKSPLW